MKTIFFFSFLVLSFSGLAQIPTTGLLGYYPFTGNANDLSGNGQNGTVNGATLTADRFGNANSAYNFNGSSNYIFLPSSTYVGLDIYSYSIWVKAASVPSNFTLPYSIGESSGSGIGQALGYQSAQTFAGTGYNVQGSPAQSIAGSSPTSPNQWVHLVVTRDYTSIKLYVNGILSTYNNTNAGTVGQNADYGSGTKNAIIGARCNLASGTYFQGIIDDIRIYTTTLTPLNVTALYNESCFQNITTSYSACESNSLALTATPSGSNTVNWYSSPTASSSIGAGTLYTTPLLTPSGIYTYYAAASTCTAYNRTAVTITVNALPNINVNSGSLCSGKSFTILPTGASTYTVSGGSTIVSPLVNTSYTITGTSAQGCQSPSAAIANVTVISSPTVAVNSGTICSGDSFTLNPTGGVSYVYSGGSSIVSPLSNSAYTVTGTSANGCSSGAISNITVLALPTLSISGITSVCAGNTTNLNVSGASSYFWSTGANTSTVSITPPGTATYFVTGTGANGCFKLATVLITVNPLPFINVNSGAICSGNSFTMLPTGANTYTYSGGSNVVSPNSSTSYSITGTSALGCLSSNVAVSNLTVTPTPSLSVNSGFVCSGSSFTLSASGALSYTYSSGSAIVSPTANTTYTITGSNGNGCSSSTISNVGVVASPTLIITNPGNICIGNSATLSVSGANFYTWDSGSNATSIVVTPTTTTNYTVTGVNFFGCLTSSVITVNVNPYPFITVNSGSVCLGNPFTIIPSGASTYTYSGGSNIVSPLVNTNYSITGTSAQGCVSSNTVVSAVAVMANPTITVNSGAVCSGNSFTINPSGAVSYIYPGGSSIVSPVTTSNYIVTGTGSNGCNATAVSTVTVYALPSVAISGLNAICIGASANYTATGASSYTWNTSANTSVISVSPLSTTTYSVLGSDINGCLNSSTKILTVNTLPFISVNSGTVCSGNSFVMTPTGASTYTFSGGSNIVTPLSNTNYSVTGTSVQGCISSNTAVSSVSVFTLPFVSVNSGSVCSGNSFVMLPSGAISYTYSSASATVTPLSNTSYTVRGSDALGCVSSPVLSNVTVVALPLISANSGSICSGNSFTISPTGASSFTISGGSSIISPVTTTVYSIIGTSSAGCISNPVTSTVTVYALPFLSVNSGTVCSGKTFTMNPTGGSTYIYSNGSNTVIPVTNTSYSITGSSSQGCPSSNTVVSTVTVVALPVLNVNSGTLCAGSIFSMNPTGAFSYTFSNGSSTVIPASNTSYTVTGTSSVGCVSSVPGISSVTVFVNPVISINGSSVICSGSATTFTASGASSYSWNTGPSTSTISVSPISNNSYIVFGTNANGCTASAVQSVSVNPLPVINATGGAICVGNSFVINPTGANNYIYSSGSATVSPSSNTTYSITGTSSAGCISASPAIITVTVNPLPTILISSTNSICYGQTATLSASGANTYSWNSGWSGSTLTVTPSFNTTYTVTGTDVNFCRNTAIKSITVNSLPTITVASGAVCPGNSFTLNPTGAATYTISGGSAIVSPASTSSYTITGTNSQGCISPLAAIATVSVFNTLTVTVSGNSTICSGEAANLTANGASTYLWNTGASTNTISLSPLTNTNYTVTGVSGTCSDVAVGTISVNPLPLVTVNSGTICSGSSFVIIPGGAITYTYSGGSSTVNPPTSSTFTVTGTDANGCVSQNAISNVMVNPLPVILGTSSSPNFICIGETATLIVSGAATYTWNSGSITSSIVITPNITTIYTVTGLDQNGCENSTTLVQNVSDCTGILETKQNNSDAFLIYPNPAQGDFSIQYDLLSAYSGELIIEDIQGKTIQVHTIDTLAKTYEVKNPNLKPGIYFCRLKINEKTIGVKKIIITD